MNPITQFLASSQERLREEFYPDYFPNEGYKQYWEELHEWKKLESFLSSELRALLGVVEKQRKPLYEIPCSDGSHNSFWKTVVESPEWVVWDNEVAKRMREGKPDEKGKWTGLPVFDVDECREMGWISEKHFKEFLMFVSLLRQPPKE